MVDQPKVNRISLRNSTALQHTYAFDRVFEDTVTQADVFVATVSDRKVIDRVLDGFNASVFAYGATGSGKTYTMMGGDNGAIGMILMTVKDLFRQIDSRRAQCMYSMRISYQEIYNERIRDLLVDDSKYLDLREQNGSCYVAGLSSMEPTCLEDVLEWLQEGNSRRSQADTAANAVSSRSHAVLQIQIEGQKLSGSEEVICSKLSLIDLAGSERARVTENRGARMKEGAHINKSLLALGNCINVLDSLGGNCTTIMMAMVSPSSLCYEDTLNTLKYANRAKEIKINPEKNTLQVGFHIKQHESLIRELQQQLEKALRQIDSMETSTCVPPSSETLHLLRKQLVVLSNQQMHMRKAKKEAVEEQRNMAVKLRSNTLSVLKWKLLHGQGVLR
eukprot:gene2227-3112_t